LANNIMVSFSVISMGFRSSFPLSLFLASTGFYSCKIFSFVVPRPSPSHSSAPPPPKGLYTGTVPHG
jgi:hypothetical protein